MRDLWQADWKLSPWQWAALAMLFLPVVYVASTGPVFVLANRCHLTAFAKIYFVPVEVLNSRFPPIVDDIIDPYARWCMSTTGTAYGL